MTRKHHSALSLAGLLLVPAISSLPFTANALFRTDEPKPSTDTKEYKIERILKKGNTDRYNVVIKAKGSNPQFGGDFTLSMDMTVRENTKEIKEGIAEFSSEFEKVLVNLGGIEQEVSSQFPTSTYKADKQGRAWDFKTEGGAPELQGEGGGNERLLSVLRSSFYPPKPVKVGDTWDVVVIEPEKKDKDGKEIVLGKGKASVVGTEKIAEFDALKIETKLEILIDSKSQKSPKFEGKGYLDKVTGKMLKMTGTIDGKIGPLGDTKADVSLSLMTGEAKKDEKPKDGEKKPL